MTDLHRHFIDHLTIPSQQGKGDLQRVPDVFDCWFESGSMPYAQVRDSEPLIRHTRCRDSTRSFQPDWGWALGKRRSQVQWPAQTHALRAACTRCSSCRVCQSFALPHGFVKGVNVPEWMPDQTMCLRINTHCRPGDAHDTERCAQAHHP